jgi:hypothetical protein
MTTTRFSGADWASELREVIVVGVGGIGSWTTLNLARIGHNITIIDPDTVDETNVKGGQMFQANQVGNSKVNAVVNICQQFGSTAFIDGINKAYTNEIGASDIMITGLDNMKARRQVYEVWKKNTLRREDKEECLLVDGRLTMEMFEIFAIKGDDLKAMELYEAKHLFSDEEAADLDCTTKQSTFAAMSIAGFITSTVCNFLTNKKLKSDLRDVPFYQRMYFPMMMYTSSAVPEESKEEAVVESVTSKTEEIP